MNVLVTGGAGYIGSHTVQSLLDSGHTPIVIDTLEHGHSSSVYDAELIKGSILNQSLLTRVLEQFNIEAVIHFAAYIEVGESMVNPLKYYSNNTMATLSLLKTMSEVGVNKFIFSSTAAVYGIPTTIPILEDSPKHPVNVYGHSKLSIEDICHWLSNQSDFRYISLRYFNACGAHPSGNIGEDHHPETHLIPLVLKTALGQRESISIYGDDYSTPDGTCIRDYIHVCDLADAHVRSMEYLFSGGSSNFFNLGTGIGYSVKEIISAAENITGISIPTVIESRRLGDPDRLIADISKSSSILGWESKFSSLESIISTAWKWHTSHPSGYNDSLVF